MTHAVLARTGRLPLLAILLISTLFFVPRAFAEPSDQTLTTKYFTIYYPAGEEKTANWYAGFADDIDASVSDLLGADPVTGITLRIYASEAEYSRANPMAGTIPGIMAHSIPQRKEIGVAVERLRQQPPELARESFRHEMTHVVAGELSGQNLPVGFQEGIAQYDELSATRGSEAAKTIQAANGRLLPWRAFASQAQFSRSLDLAYAESYSVMAFLADRYGMGDYSRFLQGLRRGLTWQDALEQAYGSPPDKLEAEWRDYLPGFLDSGYNQNLLMSYDMTPGITLYNQGQFGEASVYFAKSERLYRDLGRNAKMKEAVIYKGRSLQAKAASDRAEEARQSLEAHKYGPALNGAIQAESAFAALNLPEYGQRAGQIEQLAHSGKDAQLALQSAHNHLNFVNSSQAQTEARTAGEALASLGDSPGVVEANRIMADAANQQRSVSSLMVAVGALALLGGAALAAWSTRKRANARLRRPVPVEENASWL